jgi:hypothetical protein
MEPRLLEQVRAIVQMCGNGLVRAIPIPRMCCIGVLNRHFILVGHCLGVLDVVTSLNVSIDGQADGHSSSTFAS